MACHGIEDPKPQRRDVYQLAARLIKRMSGWSFERIGTSWNARMIWRMSEVLGDGWTLNEAGEEKLRECLLKLRTPW